jgi:hypothetical protein
MTKAAATTAGVHGAPAPLRFRHAPRCGTLTIVQVRRGGTR